MNRPTEREPVGEARTDGEASTELPETDDQGLEIKPTDLVFDCPHCGHELVIDYRGAGLTVNCTECDELVQVPIPDGMEVSDLDESPAQLFAQLLQSRRTLTKAEQRITELEGVVASLMERRSAMEKSRVATLHRCAELSSLCQALQRGQTDMSAVLGRMLTTLAEEQKL
jgi:transcription elongation factor Elf1